MSEQRERIARFMETSDYLIERYRKLWDGGTVRDLGEAVLAYEVARARVVAFLAQPASGEARGLEAVAKIIRREMQDNSIPERIRSERAAALILEPSPAP